MSNDLDTIIRDSLQAEAGDVVASPELYTRIEQATARRPHAAARRVAPWLLVAAATLVGVLLLDRGGEQKVVTPPGDSTTRPTDLPTSTTDPTEAPAPRPDQVVAVLDDGRLVVLDVESGDVVRELAAMADPRDSEGVAEPDPDQRAITDAVVAPDGETVYFGTSGGSGGVYRIPIDGSADPERISHGWGVTVSADGQRLAFAYNSEWNVLDPRTGQRVSYPLPRGESSLHVSISPDGTEVEVISFETAGGTQHQRVHTLNERMRRTSTRDGFATWQGTRFADASGRWLLEIVELDDGSTFISWGTSGEGLTTEIPNPDGLVLRTADW